MATRQELEQLILNNIPDNNSKFISAALLREVLNRINSDKFHLSEDELRNQIYQATQTLEERLQGLPIERRATIGPYEWNDGTQSIGIIKDPDNIIVDAIKAKVNALDLYIDIEFSENITEKYIDIFSRLPNNQGISIPSGNQLLPSNIKQLVDPISTNKIRVWQSRRDDQGVGNHAIEIILK